MNDYTMIPMEMVLERIAEQQKTSVEKQWSYQYQKGVADTKRIILEVAEDVNERGEP